MGSFKNGGKEYQPAGHPDRVNVHDFPGDAEGKAIPYGIYDLGANTGWVSVGTDHDTAAFAVAALRRWWNTTGKNRYPQASGLLVCANAGGSNSYRIYAWKIGSPGWQPRPAWRSPAATSRPAPANGTKSSTGCSPRSPSTGAVGR